MECADPALFDTWTSSWEDLVEFEIVPVVTSAVARERALGPEPEESRHDG
jgi:hypothetical protein